MPILLMTIGEVGSNSHCLLDNCKMIDGQSCGVNTSQIKKEEEFLSKTPINIMANGVR